MGREVRMVPENWQHPKDHLGRYIPLFGRSESDFKQAVADWDEGAEKWAQGLRSDPLGAWIPLTGEEIGKPYSWWDGLRPDPADYMPFWAESERTHLMMYEDTTEGTPISPAFSTPEALARWLADNNASMFARMGASYEDWLRICEGAPSLGLMIRIPPSL